MAVVAAAVVAVVVAVVAALVVAVMVMVKGGRGFNCSDFGPVGLPLTRHDLHQLLGSAFTDKGLIWQLFLFPGFCTARRMKLQIQLTYSTPEKAYGLRNVGGTTRRFILTMSHVIKVLTKFHVLDNSIPQKTEQIQTTFF